MENNILKILDGQYLISEDGVNTDTLRANAAAANQTANNAQQQGIANNKGNTVYGVGKDTSNEDVDQKIKDNEKKCNFYISTAQAILIGKITAVEFIYDQFMKIIRAHVESYIGVQGSTGNRVAQTDNTSSGTAQATQLTGNETTGGT